MRRGAKIAWGVAAAVTLLTGEEIYNTVRADTQAEKEALADDMRDALNNIAAQIGQGAGNSRPMTVAEAQAAGGNIIAAKLQETAACYTIHYDWGKSGEYSAIIVDGKQTGRLPRSIAPGFMNCDGKSISETAEKIRTINDNLAAQTRAQIMQERNPQLVISNFVVIPAYKDPQVTSSYEPFPPGPRTWIGKLRARYFTKKADA